MTIKSDKKIHEIFQLTTDLAEKIVSEVKSLNASDVEELVYKGAMHFFFCKAYKSYQAIRILWFNGFAEDCFILARTIFEIALQARYMKENPKSHARLFAEHDPVEKYRYYKRLKKVGDSKLIEAIENRSDELLKIKKMHDEFHKKYPQGKGWWGESIHWLAKHCGKETERRYATTYWMQSNLVHTGITSTTEYIADRGKSLKVNCYPSQTGDPMIPIESTLFFLDVIRNIADALNVVIDKEYQIISEKLVELT